MRKAIIKIDTQMAGWLTQDDKGYHFEYAKAYLNQIDAKPVSLTLPLQEAIYTSNILFPFFDGLIPEGWLLDIAEKNWKLNPRDRMGLLLACCKDCIGTISVEELKEEDNDSNDSKLKECMSFIIKVYEKGYSSIDLIRYIEKNANIEELKKYEYLITFQKVKREFRNEKILMLFILYFLVFRSELTLENISFI